MVEGGCYPEEDLKEQMGKGAENFLDVGDEFKNWQSLVRHFCSPFKPNEAPPIINNYTKWFNYVDVDPTNIMYDLMLLAAYKIWL